jgi:cyclopropane-fatty-acyl-phospholipid synthase
VKHFGAQVTGVTVSEQRAMLARQRARDLPMKIETMDFRDLSGTFDRIDSIGISST